MQLKLTFVEIPNPSADVWATLEEEQRVAALERLAKLIANAAQPEPSAEDADDE